MSCKITEALQNASKLPYTNAAIVYHAAGEVPDPRMGGSCLDKLHHLGRELSTCGIHALFVNTNINPTLRHYAARVASERGDLYLDPLLFQAEPLNLIFPPGSRASTLVLSGQVELDESIHTDCFGVSFIRTLNQCEKTRVMSYQFDETGITDQLPHPSSIKVRPGLPAFQLQIPDPDDGILFKAMFLKANNTFGDIWKQQPDGSRVRIKDSQAQNNERRTALGRIADLVGMKSREIVDYLITAGKLEKEMPGYFRDSC